MKPRRLARVLWALAAAVFVLVLLKSFVADVYRVDSGSMRPTLFGGRERPDSEEESEDVLVLYDRDFRPQRFDLVVIRSSDGSEPLVKRVCGLPKESVLVHEGDLFIDGQRLPADAPRPAPVPVYDDRYFDAERLFEYRRDGSVKRADGEWVIEGGAVAPGSLVRFHPDLRDDYLDSRHQRVLGSREVNDAVLELEFMLEGPLVAQRLHFQLVEAGDTFEVVLAAGAEGLTLRLVRRNPRTMTATPDPTTGEVPPRELELASRPVPLAAGKWYALHFANIDNHLILRVPALALEVVESYAENVPLRDDLPAGMKSVGSRVAFGVEAGRARFRAVRILRDLFYTEDGTFGTRSALTLGPDEYFLLGDNSSASTDSRLFGQVDATRFIGRPLAVVWPSPRWLAGAQKP